MESYNTKVTRYNNSVQVKTYKRSIVVGRKRPTDESKANSSSGSIERTQSQVEHSLNVSINRTKQAIYSYALSNEWQYFCTFTFNPRLVLSSDFEECVRAFSKWLQVVHQRVCPDIVYLVVPEYHSDKKKFHFHCLMSNIEGLLLVDSGKRSNDRILYNIYNYTLGFSTAVKIDNEEFSQEKICNYMLKYITKDLVSLSKGKKRYWISKNTIKKPVVDYYLLDSDFSENIKKKSLDVCKYTKTIDIEQSHNRVNIYNI